MRYLSIRLVQQQLDGLQVANFILNVVENTRRSFGYASVFRLVQNKICPLSLHQQPLNKSIIAAVIAFIYCTPLLGQVEGNYDMAYGNGGVALIDGTLQDLYVEEMAIQPDGKLVLAGYANYAERSAFLGRLNLDGSLDSSFADNGIFIYDQTDGYENYFQSVEVLADGKIIATGRLNNDGLLDWNPLIVRLNPEGTLDPSFGTENGITAFGTEYEEQMYKGAVTPNGKFIATGFLDNGDERFPIICRWDENGLPDASFDDFMVHLNAPELIGGYLYNVAADAAGNTYAIGATENNELLLVKTTNAGAPDTNFGDNGIYLLDVPIGITNILYDIKLTQSGDLLICGNLEGELLITKRNAETGAPISSFGDNGTVLIDVWGHYNSARDILELPDGQIIITGSSNQTISLTSTVILKLNEDGTPNPDWGLNGIVFFEFDGTDTHSIGSGVQPDGKIVSVCWSHLNQLIAVRYLSEAVSGIANNSPAVHQLFLSPNPTNSRSIFLEYELQRPSKIQVDLYDMLGQPISTILQAGRPAGLHTEALELPKGLSTGSYLIRVESAFGVSTMRVVVE
ncbi:MAG: T9SS type A sorting domain-containing protein [Phaeodactylibacter sp.]|nr:T9SS type A sorting domain-containing protein [Phaeodactylibacter sp.]